MIQMKAVKTLGSLLNRQGSLRRKEGQSELDYLAKFGSSRADDGSVTGFQWNEETKAELNKYQLPEGIAGRFSVISSNLDSISYDINKEELEVWFKGGGSYTYYQVPPMTVKGLLAAPSKGSFFHDHIRTSYSYRKN